MQDQGNVAAQLPKAINCGNTSAGELVVETIIKLGLTIAECLDLVCLDDKLVNLVRLLFLVEKGERIF